jgi:non-homologous end joining protein Ku
MKVIKAKMKGKKVSLPEPEKEEDTGVLDLMSRLRASLEQGEAKKPAATKKAASRSRARTAKRKSA